MAAWHHRHNGYEFEQTLGNSEGQGSLVCCSPWGCKESGLATRQQNIFIFGYAGSWFLRGLLSSCDAPASHCSGFSCCGTWGLGVKACGLQKLQLPDSRAQVQQLWHMGFAVLRHMGYSWIKDGTCVSCIGRLILNQWTTREVPNWAL